MKTINELISDLEQLRDSGNEYVPGVFSLIELAYGERVANEHRARERMVLDAGRAKLQAGFPRTAKFFLDVWPSALAALKAKTNNE